MNTQMIFLTLKFENTEGNDQTTTNPRFRLNFNSDGDTFSRSDVEVVRSSNITGTHYYPPNSLGDYKNVVLVLNPHEDTRYGLAEVYMNLGAGSFFHSLMGNPAKGRGVAFELQHKYRQPILGR